MAHFAKIENGFVSEIVVVSNNDAPDEASGLVFLKQLYGAGIIWKKTSYNTHGGVHTGGGIPFRKNYAGIGDTYDSVRDAYIPPKPYPSWVLNETTCLYDAPIPMPQDGKIYAWDETVLNWVVTP